MNNLACLKCGSTSIYKSKKFNVEVCEDCGERFELSDGMTKWKFGL